MGEGVGVGGGVDGWGGGVRVLPGKSSHLVDYS